MDDKPKLTRSGGECIVSYKNKMFRFGGFGNGPIGRFYVASTIDQHNKSQKLEWRLKEEWKLA